MASGDIRETVEVETSDAVDNLDKLKQSSKEADTQLDTLKQTADKVDQETVSIPVEVPGAKQAGADVEDVGRKARDAESEVKGGFGGMGQSVSDLTGPLGDVSGKVSELSQMFQGAQESLSNFTGASPGLMMGLAAAVGLGIIAWQQFNDEQERVRAKQQEILEGMKGVQDQLAQGNIDAAAQQFAEQNIDNLRKLSELTGLSVGTVTKAVLGDPAAVQEYNDALKEVNADGISVARIGMASLHELWIQSANDWAATNAVKDAVTDAFTTMTDSGVDPLNAALDANHEKIGRAITDAAQLAIVTGARAAGLPAGPLSFPGPRPSTGADFPGGTIPGTVINLFPAANTPLAVESAQQDFRRIQGPQ